MLTNIWQRTEINLLHNSALQLKVSMELKTIATIAEVALTYYKMLKKDYHHSKTGSITLDSEHTVQLLLSVQLQDHNIILHILNHSFPLKTFYIWRDFQLSLQMSQTTGYLLFSRTRREERKSLLDWMCMGFKEIGQRWILNFLFLVVMLIVMGQQSVKSAWAASNHKGFRYSVALFFFLPGKV